MMIQLMWQMSYVELELAATPHKMRRGATPTVLVKAVTCQSTKKRWQWHDDLSPDLDDLLANESDDDDKYEPPHPAKAMDPDNYIQDLQALKSCIEDNLDAQHVSEPS
jgi:hypothetical protein